LTETDGPLKLFLYENRADLKTLQKWPVGEDQARAGASWIIPISAETELTVHERDRQLGVCLASGHY
jgi:hypothetical protein